MEIDNKQKKDAFIDKLLDENYDWNKGPSTDQRKLDDDIFLVSKIDPASGVVTRMGAGKEKACDTVEKLLKEFDNTHHKRKDGKTDVIYLFTIVIYRIEDRSGSAESSPAPKEKKAKPVKERVKKEQIEHPVKKERPGYSIKKERSEYLVKKEAVKD